VEESKKEMTEWTVATLKEHTDVRFDAVKEAISKADTVAETRALKLEAEMRNKFSDVNEFRGQQKDMINTLVPRGEYLEAIKGLEEKINAKNVQIVVSLSVGFIGILIAVFNLASRLAGG
jgi:hypothetical protein